MRTVRAQLQAAAGIFPNPFFSTVYNGVLKTYSKWNWKSFCSLRTVSGHFFANYMDIFLKTEVQTVILRCLTGLKLNWLKSYDTKCKHFHFHFFAFLSKKTQVCFLCFCGFFCILCHNFWANWDLDLLGA